MKLHFKIRAVSTTQEHELDLSAPPRMSETDGRLDFVVNGKAGQADWSQVSGGDYSLLLDGRSYNVRVARRQAEPAAGGAAFDARVGNRDYQLELRDPRRRKHSGPAEAGDGPLEILAPMPGRVVKILVAENQNVGTGDSLLVIEAMKMQNELRAPRAGCVQKIFVEEGAGVETNGKLLRLAPIT
jgi:glutaconyl-CoA/methylmalonyl-CoA decarboxylase subunit gamma